MWPGATDCREATGCGNGYGEGRVAASLRCERGRTYQSSMPRGRRDFRGFGTARLERPESSPSVHQIERTWNGMNVRGTEGRCN